MERFLRNYSPPQPKLPKTSEDKLLVQRNYEKENRNRTFLPKWKTEFTWLECDSVKGMLCCICTKYEKVGTFVTGCKNFKKHSILTHDKSQGHIMNKNRFYAEQNPSKTPASRMLMSLNEKTFAQLNIKFKTAHYISKKGRPFTDYTVMCELDEAKGMDIGPNYRSDKSAADFCHSIAEGERLSIRNKLKAARFISCISDGTTDSSYQETEIIFIRSCHKGEIKVYFSLVKNIPRGDAESIAKVMIEGMKNLAGEQCFKKLVGTGTDGASTMLGVKSGAVQRLREASSRPFIIGIHCSGHKLELAVKDVLKSNIPLYNKVDIFLLNIYHFYRNSNVNRSGLKDSFKALDERVILPTRVGGTRWIGHTVTAIQHFLRGYQAIRQHLEQLQNPDVGVSRTEKGNKAKSFFNIVSSKDVWLMMHFLLDIFTILADISSKFQSQTATISEIMDEITFGIKNLEKFKSSDGPNLRKALNSEHPLKGNDIPFKSARSKIIPALTESLSRRFTDNQGIIEASSVFNLSNFPASKDETKDYGEDKIVKLVDHFETALVEAGIDTDRCESEWTKLKDGIMSRFPKLTSITWGDINEKLENLCPNILALVDLILTIPASSADAERGFNHLKLTKSDWRSKLGDKTLSDQLIIILEAEDVKNFDPTQAINLWLQTPRRLRESKSTDQTDQIEADETETETETPSDNVQDNDVTDASIQEAEEAYNSLCEILD